MTLSLIDENLVIDFLDWLEKTRKVSMTTRNQRLVALHSFFRYVQKNSPIHMELSAKILNIPYKKAPRTVVSYLCEDDMRTLLAQPSGNTREGFRDMVLLSVLYDTGARVQELVDIKVKHILLTCVVGPVNTYFRYMVPIVFSLPLIIGLIYKETKTKKM